MERHGFETEQFPWPGDAYDPNTVGARLRKSQTYVPLLDQQDQCRWIPLSVQNGPLQVSGRRGLLDQGIELAVTPWDHLKGHALVSMSDPADGAAEGLDERPEQSQWLPGEAR